jgi:hypothetical protein
MSTDALEPVYDWLVDELHNPFDLHTAKPPWLDTGRLAAKWAQRDGETVENYRWAILEETGWPQ